MKTLVLYYSQTRKTASVAETISQELSADTVEIKDLKERSGFFNSLKSTIDAFRENKTKINPENVDLSDYGLIYIGTPTWGGKPAPAIITLIDRCNFQGKDVILFTTMGGKGGNTTIKRMKEKLEARGARIVNFFIIRTGGKEIIEIKEDTRKIIEELDLKIYEYT